MAESAPLLEPRGLDTPLSGLHCELLSFLHNNVCSIREASHLDLWDKLKDVFTPSPEGRHQFTGLVANFFQSYPTVYSPWFKANTQGEGILCMRAV